MSKQQPMFVQEVKPEDWPDCSWMTTKPSRVWYVGGYLAQEFREPDGIVRLSIVSAKRVTPSQGRGLQDGIPWDDLQQIKDRLGYHGRDAVEVYPAEDDLVDVANMRHLWILPYRLPFAWRREGQHPPVSPAWQAQASEVLVRYCPDCTVPSQGACCSHITALATQPTEGEE